MSTINEQLTELLKLKVDLDRMADLPNFYDRIKTVYYVNKTTGEKFTEGEATLSELHEKKINLADYERKVKHISRADIIKAGIFGNTSHYITDEEIEMYNKLSEVISDLASMKVPNILNPQHKDYNFRKELANANSKIQYLKKSADKDKESKLAEAEAERKLVFEKHNKEYKPLTERKTNTTEPTPGEESSNV